MGDQDTSLSHSTTGLGIKPTTSILHSLAIRPLQPIRSYLIENKGVAFEASEGGSDLKLWVLDSKSYGHLEENDLGHEKGL